MMRALLIIAGIVVYIPMSLYLLWIVHRSLDRCIVRHARKYCRKNGLEIGRVRWQPAFKPSGGKKVKTEFTLVQLDCLDAHKQRRLVLLMVWPFGVRRMVSDEKYPESYDEQWPQNAPTKTRK